MDGGAPLPWQGMVISSKVQSSPIPPGKPENLKFIALGLCGLYFIDGVPEPQDFCHRCSCYCPLFPDTDMAYSLIFSLGSHVTF